MSDGISISRANPFPMAPEEKANQEQRIEHLIGMLRKAPVRAKAYVAGDECDGVIPVTLASRLCADLIVIWELGITAKCWDPARFQNEFIQGMYP